MATKAKVTTKIAAKSAPTKNVAKEESPKKTKKATIAGRLDFVTYVVKLIKNYKQSAGATAAGAIALSRMAIIYGITLTNAISIAMKQLGARRSTIRVDEVLFAVKVKTPESLRDTILEYTNAALTAYNSNKRAVKGKKAEKAGITLSVSRSKALLVSHLQGRGIRISPGVPVALAAALEALLIHSIERSVERNVGKTRITNRIVSTTIQATPALYEIFGPCFLGGGVLVTATGEVPMAKKPTKRVAKK